MIRSKENIRKVLDGIMSGANYRRVMESIGGKEATLFDWVAKSSLAEKDGDTASDFFLDWPDGSENDYFHRLVPKARTRRGLLLESVIADQVVFGIDEIVIEGGKLCYALEEKWVGVSDEVMEVCHGIHPTQIAWERIKRNDAGMPVPLTRKVQAAATVKVKLLEGLLPEIFGQKVEHNITNHVGVMVVGAPAKKPLALPAPELPETDLVRDLRAKLAAGIQNPKPDGRVEIFAKDNPNDPTERVAAFAADEPTDLRGPTKPAPATAPAPQPSYAKPAKVLPVDRPGYGPGAPPPGGARVA